MQTMSTLQHSAKYICTPTILSGNVVIVSAVHKEENRFRKEKRNMHFFSNVSTISHKLIKYTAKKSQHSFYTTGMVTTSYSKCSFNLKKRKFFTKTYILQYHYFNTSVSQHTLFLHMHNSYNMSYHTLFKYMKIFVEFPLNL